MPALPIGVMISLLAAGMAASSELAPTSGKTGGSVSLLSFPGLREMSPSFLRSYDRAMRGLGLNPDFVSGLIFLESRWLPNATNVMARRDQPIDPVTGKHGKAIVAAGLPQLYWTEAPKFGTTVEAFARMTAEEQLPFLVRIWQAQIASHPGTTWTPENVYMANFIPKYVNAPDSQVIGAKDSPDAYTRAVYLQNPGLDTGGKGYITAGDMYRRIRGALAAAASRPRVVV